MKKIIIIMAIMLLLAQSANSMTTARVRLTVAGDENLKGEVKSYLSRELRSLNDILITDENLDYELRVIAMNASTTAQRDVGIILSVTILKPLQAFRKIVGDKNENYDSDFSIFLIDWLRIGGNSDLRQLCQSIIADFDSDFLEHDRKVNLQKLEKSKKGQ